MQLDPEAIFIIVLYILYQIISADLGEACNSHDLRCRSPRAVCIQLSSERQKNRIVLETGAPGNPDSEVAVVELSSAWLNDEVGRNPTEGSFEGCSNKNNSCLPRRHETFTDDRFALDDSSMQLETGICLCPKEAVPVYQKNLGYFECCKLGMLSF
ncbi:unnamed protein product [Protopolystoma xenopodis]|uniref:Uncharacterized protein n=1 Tax=Protopolystoma xenopodis TaxID=117903 RepID=A0A448XLJ1_9PLAT|nr:unnamed protein product [Protopolystoma xenopodis]